MIQADLSNIWSCVSLPDLLSGEKDLFDAHLLLRNNQPDGPDFLGWLGAPETVTARTLHTIRKAAETIRTQSDTLVVLGSGCAWLAAQAGIRLLSGLVPGEGVNVLFAGSNLSDRSYHTLFSRLEGREFSLLLLSEGVDGLEVTIAARSVRWMMERRYGADSKSRIFVAAPVASPMAVMAAEEEYTFLPLPKELGGADSALTAAALLPMEAAGIDALEILGGAAGAWREYDLRAFENPVWMYAGARHVLESRGKTGELLCSFEPEADALSRWWQMLMLRRTCREGLGVIPMTACYPQWLDGFESALQHRSSPLFETVLQFPPVKSRAVSVEMDWKNYDGHRYLSGRTLSEVRQASCEALLSSHADLDIPAISLSCGAVNARTLGELLYFFELSAALCAADDAMEPFSPAPCVSRKAAQALLAREDV